MQVSVNTLEDLRRLAELVAESGPDTLTIALTGELGAGKTQFVRFFASALGVAAEDVTSPTYVLLQRYVGRSVIFHFDFYRLESSEQVWDLGIDELYEQPVWILIEWADKFPQCLPPDYLSIHLHQEAEEARFATLQAQGAWSQRLLAAMEQASRDE